MSGADVTVLRTPRRRRDASLLTAGLFAAIAAALLPVFSVIAPGPWVAGAVLVTAGVLGAGLLVRLARLPAVLASVAEIVVGVALLTAIFGRTTSLLLVIPTPGTFATVPRLLDAAAKEIRVGVAPVPPETGLAFLLVAAIAGLAVVLDHVVLTARMPLLAGVGLVAVSLIPTIAIPSDVDVVAFVLLAAALLFLLRVDTRARTAVASRARSRTRSASPRPRWASPRSRWSSRSWPRRCCRSRGCVSPRAVPAGWGPRSTPISSSATTCASHGRSTC